MNRSILIVICDFLVSAMLSMTTGMVAVSASPGTGGGRGVIDNHTVVLLLNELRARQVDLEKSRAAILALQEEKGFSAERDAKLKALTEELAEARTRAEQLQKKLEIDRKKAGPLSPAQLQAKLDKEIHDRHVLKIRYEDNAQLLKQMRTNLQNATGDLVKAAENIAVSRQQLEDSRTQLREREAKLESVTQSLGGTKAELAARSRELDTVKQSLQQLIVQGGVEKKHSKRLQSDLAFVQGRLSATERDLAAARSQANRSRKLAEQRELERAAAERQMANLQKMLKTAVSDLTKAKKELGAVRKRAEVSERDLAATQVKLGAAEEKLRSDVLERYSSSAVKIDIRIAEKGVFREVEGGGVYYYPAVRTGNKTVLIGLLRDLAGAGKKPLSFRHVTKLACQAANPAGKLSPVSARLLFVDAEPRAAALELNLPPNTKPIGLISRSELKKRGVSELFLFKPGSFGKNSVPLDGRCSLDLTGDGKYLFIRNGGRSSISDMRAETGDFVLTKQGDFVGVVVAQKDSEMGRKQEALCYLFPDRFQFSKNSVALEKQPGEAEYSAFAGAVRNALAGESGR